MCVNRRVGKDDAVIVYEIFAGLQEVDAMSVGAVLIVDFPVSIDTIESKDSIPLTINIPIISEGTLTCWRTRTSRLSLVCGVVSGVNVDDPMSRHRTHGFQTIQLSRGVHFLVHNGIFF